MVRTAVRALTLNVYHGEFQVVPILIIFFVFTLSSLIVYLPKCNFHCVIHFKLYLHIKLYFPFYFPVGDDCVNRYVTSTPHADYFSNLVTFFREQCIELSRLVSDSMK